MSDKVLTVHYTTKELLSRGYGVKTMALPPMPTDDLLPKEVERSLGNINELSDQEIVELLSDVKDSSMLLVQMSVLFQKLQH